MRVFDTYLRRRLENRHGWLSRELSPTLYSGGEPRLDIQLQSKQFACLLLEARNDDFSQGIGVFKTDKIAVFVEIERVFAVRSGVIALNF